jgi:acyl-CoA dehydrogenase
MFTHAVKGTKDGVQGWVINGGKMWISGMHKATHCLVFARTHGKPGDALGITAFFVPKGTPGFEIESYEWTFNMPTDHASMLPKRHKLRMTADDYVQHSHLPTSSCLTQPFSDP